MRFRLGTGELEFIDFASVAGKPVQSLRGRQPGEGGMAVKIGGRAFFQEIAVHRYGKYNRPERVDQEGRPFSLINS